MTFARVGDIAEQVRGVTYSKGEARDTPSPDHVALLRAGNIGESELLLEDLTYVPSGRVSSRQRLRQGDVLIAASSGSLSVVGKAARVVSPLDATFGAFCKVLRPVETVDAGYFAHYFRTRDYRRYISSVAAGANINNIRAEDLDRIELPLPPLPEQRRIAAILDEADALRTTCNAPIARAAVLREHIARSSIREAIEGGARHMRLGDLVKFSSGRFLPAKSQRAGEVTVYGGNGPSGRHDEAMFTSPQLVVGRVGALCGAVHVTEGRVWVTDNALIASWDSNLISIEHLAWQLRLANLNQYAAVSGQPSISAARIGDVPIVLPSAQEARHFAGLEAETQELIARLGSREKLLTALFASLQHGAFRGEL